MSEANAVEKLGEWAQQVGILATPSIVPSQPTNGARPLPRIESLTDALNRDVPPPEILVEGLIHRGTKISLAGGSKSFKTWTMLDLGISVATGVPFWGQKTTAGTVLFVNLEVQEFFMAQRVRHLLAAKSIAAPANFFLWNLRGHACPAELIVPSMVAAIISMEISLIVIDPIYKLMGGGDENSPADIGEVLNHLESMAVDTGAAVLFGAHFSKGNQASKDVLDRVSGSGVFARDPDSILTLTKHAEEGAFVFEPILRNFPPMKPFVVRWEAPLMSRADDLDAAEFKQPRKTGAIAKKIPTLDEFLGIFPTAISRDSLLTASDVSAEFVRRGWDKGTVVKLREEAIRLGRISMRRGAHNKLSIGLRQVVEGFDPVLEQMAPLLEGPLF